MNNPTISMYPDFVERPTLQIFNGVNYLTIQPDNYGTDEHKVTISITGHPDVTTNCPFVVSRAIADFLQRW